jgi:hypothetical protein
MKKTLHILICLNQTALLESVNQELSFLVSQFHIKYVKLLREAEDYLKTVLKEDLRLAMLVCSDSFSKDDGVELMVQLRENS